MKSILMVCTGNICRSPMAAILLQALLAQDPARQQWTVSSAGLWAADGVPASDHAVTVMRDRGHDLTRHRSRQVTAGIIDQADLILGMTDRHTEALRLAFPQAAERVYLMSEMAGGSHSIEDPYGHSIDFYRRVADELDNLIAAGYSQIVEYTEQAAK